MSFQGAYTPTNSNQSDLAKTISICNGASNTESKKEEPSFQCNICLETATDAVVSMCGHLFCWPCLHTWLIMKPGKQVCPVCNSAIGKETVVPIYGRENSKQEDPRQNVPPRPAGLRVEREQTSTEDSEYTIDSDSEDSSSPSIDSIAMFNPAHFDLDAYRMSLANAFPFRLLSPIPDILESVSSSSSIFTQYMAEIENSDCEI